MAPQVEFHTGVADPVHFACRLLRKAYRQRSTLAVRAPAPTLAALDRALWVFEPQDFVPHLLLHAGSTDAAALRRTPIWLVEGAVPDPGPAVLVNLGAEIDAADGRFARLIEIVGTDADAVRAARQRWRRCEQFGWPIRHHPAGGAKASG